MILKYGPEIYIQKDDAENTDDDDDYDLDSSKSDLDSLYDVKSKGAQYDSYNPSSRSMSLEDLRVTLVGTDELKMFEAWKKKRNEEDKAKCFSTS